MLDYLFEKVQSELLARSCSLILVLLTLVLTLTLTLTLLLLLRVLPDHNIVVPILARRQSLDITGNTSLHLRDLSLPLAPDELEVVRQETVAGDGAPVGGRGKGGNDASADEDGEVEAVLGVPFWCYTKTKSIRRQPLFMI